MSNQFSLDHLASFSIEGPDARSFAQSQLTVSVESLDAAVWAPLAWCDPKGRVEAFMMGRSSENDVELILPAMQADDVRQRLGRFTIGRRVDFSTTRSVAGTFDPGAKAPTLSFDPERGMLAGIEAPSAPELLERWRRMDLCRALPWLGPETSGKHLPQWLGLEELGGLAYDKGCYPGQEVIARLHYRGSVKYRLSGLKFDAAATFLPHARITDQDGTGVGHWLDGMEVDGGTIGLAVLSTRIQSDDEVVLQGEERSHAARVTPPEALC